MQETPAPDKLKKDSHRLSEEINRLYTENKNYLIEYSERSIYKAKYCIIYFSSNNIFYPDSEEIFYEQIIKKNRYEWYHTRVQYGTKHIFMRDIKKRHYLSGININLNTIEKVVDFLRAETYGYNVITVGSSSGGYAAVFFGQKLNADRIYSFNGQFVLDINYPLFRGIEKSIVKNYSDMRNFFVETSKIFYFHSNRSAQDIKQFKLVENTGVQILSFNASVHGVPFLKCCLPIVLNLSVHDLMILSQKRNNPWVFSIKMVGIWKTLVGSFEQFQDLALERSLTRTLKSALAL